MSDAPDEAQAIPQTPCVVCLLDPSMDQVHDGFALASFLRVDDLPCQVKRFSAAALKTEVARELSEAAGQVVFFAASDHNLQRVQLVAGLLSEELVACLFGRQLSDPTLRGQVDFPPATCVIVGEPYVPARDLARKITQHPDLRGDFRVAGTYRPGQSFVPLAPPFDLNVIPPGDYGRFDDISAHAIPLQTSRGYPFPLVFSARRQWELPVRSQRPERVAGDMERYLADFSARHFVFTDMATNAGAGMLLDVANLILDMGLKVFWYATIWPDPALDRAAVHQLARSGCRGLELCLHTASTDLAGALNTGVEMEAVDALIEHCQLEGITLRPRLTVGFPRETRQDRLVTMTWLARQAGAVGGARLEACRIQHGAPLYWHADLYIPADGADDQWHDGGENNHSKRTVWLRELAAWADLLGVQRTGGPAAVHPDTGREVCDRVAAQVDDSLLSEPAWKQRRLALCGVMHGREAFCGPESLHLDLEGMDRGAALGLVAEAAAMGTRELVLGRLDATGEGEDTGVLDFEPLDEVLATAREAGLKITLCASLDHEIDADRLREVTAGVQQVEVEAHSAEQWERVERWVPVMAQARADRQGVLPRICLRAWLDANSDGLRDTVERAARLGVDRLELALQRNEQARMGTDQLAAAQEELTALLGECSRGAPVTAPQWADRRFWRANSQGGELLSLDSGWPPGFTLAPGEDDAWTCTCPAGAVSRRLHGHCSDESAVHAAFDEPTCRSCEMLRGCPVHRQEFTVRVGLLLLEGTSRLLEDLSDADSGLGRAQATVDGDPCLVGWTEARVDAAGDLYVCATCGADPVGNVVESSLASVWYSRELNEFRRMTLGASLALPYIDRRSCGLGCPRLGDNLALMEHLGALSEAHRGVLEDAGSGDRLDGSTE